MAVSYGRIGNLVYRSPFCLFVEVLLLCYILKMTLLKIKACNIASKDV